MKEGEEMMELRDGEYKFWVPYAEEGSSKKPGANSIYIKTWIASAEALGKKPSDFIGQFITLDKIPTVLFKTDKDDSGKALGLGEDGEKIYRDITVTNYFCFVPDEEDEGNFVEYLQDKLNGLNDKAALRFLMFDDRAKQHPEYKDAAKAGTLAELLDMEIIDDVYTAKG